MTVCVCLSHIASYLMKIMYVCSACLFTLTFIRSINLHLLATTSEFMIVMCPWRQQFNAPSVWWAVCNWFESAVLVWLTSRPFVKVNDSRRITLNRCQHREWQRMGWAWGHSCVAKGFAASWSHEEVFNLFRKYNLKNLNLWQFPVFIVST